MEATGKKLTRFSLFFVLRLPTPRPSRPALSLALGRLKGHSLPTACPWALPLFQSPRHWPMGCHLLPVTSGQSSLCALSLFDELIF